MSRWMTPFWWACWIAWQTGRKSSRRWRSESVLVAVMCDGDALDEFHDEERPARFGDAGIQHAGDVRMVHQGQGLPLGLKTRQDLLGVHPRLDDLHGYEPFDRLRLLGHVHRAHAAFADFLDEFVATGDDHPGRGMRWIGGCDARRGWGVRGSRIWPGIEGLGDFPQRLVQRIAGCLASLQQYVQSLAEGIVTRAGMVQEAGPFGGRFFPGKMEQGFFVHDCYSPKKKDRHDMQRVHCQK